MMVKLPAVAGRRHAFDHQVSRAALASALVSLGLAGPISAQSFQGSVTGAQGVTTGIGSTVVTVNPGQSILNWAPTDTSDGGGLPINFQPSGTTSFVVAQGSTLSFTVLNRIIPTGAAAGRAIQFNGTVSSGARNAVWFYAPGGIVLGGTARFNVGSLLLTTAEPVVDGNGNFLVGGQFELTGVANSTAAIRMETNSQINASAADGYVVLMAPQIETVQGSAIVLGGSSALVAADSARFTMAGGLFDIAVSSGTSVAAAMRVSGDVVAPGGIPIGAPSGLPLRMYFVAVPKNQALTMALTSGVNLGFDIANAADIDGNAIVLSAGYDITEATNGPAGVKFSDAPSGAGAASIVLDWTSASSALFGKASAAVTARSVTGPLDFASLLSLQGAQSAVLGTDGGFDLRVGADLILSADAGRFGAADGANRTAGTATLLASNGDIDIVGSATVSAVAIGGNSSGAGGNAVGGLALVSTLNGNVILIGNSATVDMRAQGGAGAATGGNAQGGGGPDSGFLASGTGSRIVVSGIASGLASGTGGDAATDQPAGNGTGGSLLVSTLSGGTVDLLADSGAEALILDARGIAGSLGFVLGQQLSIGNGAAGRGLGGVARVTAGAGNINVLGQTVLDSSALGGNGGAAGTATGGLAIIEAADPLGTATFFDNVALLTDGDVLSFTDTNQGSAGQGGTAQINVSGGVIGVLNESNVALSANGRGGRGDSGGDGLGGNALLGGSAGQLLVSGSVTLSSGGTGNDGNAIGGRGVGGNAILRGTDADGPMDLFIGDINLFSSGSGGDSADGTPGEGAGGLARFELDGVDASVAAMNIFATGSGGGGGESVVQGTGGSGRGGAVEILVARAALTVTEVATFFASGSGASGAVSGGDGIGGQIEIAAQSGDLASIISFGVLDATATGIGGLGANGDEFGSLSSDGGRGGAGVGGSVLVSGAAVNGSVIVTDAVLDASGRGGQGGEGEFESINAAGAGGRGGDGLGGVVSFGVQSGNLPVSSFNGQAEANLLQLLARGNGGSGGRGGGGSSGISGDGGDGGEGRGGVASVVARGGVVEISDLLADVSARGGNGLDAGVGTLLGAAGAGGAARSDLSGARASIIVSPHEVSGDGNADVRLGAANVVADAVGGNANFGNAGVAAAGTALASISQTSGAAALSGQITSQSLVLSAVARGGRSARGLSGAATGGTAMVDVSDGNLATQTLQVFANGIGQSVDLGSIGDASGGSAMVRLAGGTIAVEGLVSIEASGLGASPAGIGVGGNATGGLASMVITSAGGTANMGGLQVRADAAAGDGTDGGGSATAGTARLALSGGALSLVEILRLSAEATGGGVDFSTGYGVLPGAIAGAGNAGLLEMLVDAAVVDVAGPTNLNASGTGGSGNLSRTDGGDSQGGTINLIIGNTAPATVLLGELVVSAGALGGDAASGQGSLYGPGAGGNGIGGVINIAVVGSGSAFETTTLTTLASARGGVGGEGSESFDAGANGGSATGGAIEVAVRGGARGDFGTVEQFADGSGGRGGNGAAGAAGNAGLNGEESQDGGDGANGGNGGAAGTGGQGVGGTARLVLNAPEATATLTAVAVNQQANGVGGAGGEGGAGGVGGAGGFGGNAQAGPGGAGGDGGAGGTGAIGGRGGNAEGGAILLGRDDAGIGGLAGTMTLGEILQSARAQAGAGAAGGNAGEGGNGGAGGIGVVLTGQGSVEVQADSGSFGDFGFAGGGGAGGFAAGGLASVRSANINFESENLLLDASAFGGAGGAGGDDPLQSGAIDPGGTGGDAVGGQALFNVQGGVVQAGTVTLFGRGFGGAGGLGSRGEGIGPSGRGGDALASVGGNAPRAAMLVTAGEDSASTAALVTIDNLLADAVGTGGAGAERFESLISAGGSGAGGLAELLVDDFGGSSRLDVVGDLILRGDGLGGVGEDIDPLSIGHALGFGGVAQARLAGGTLTIGGQTIVRANGVGGTGAGATQGNDRSGGDGSGGSAALSVVAGQFDAAGPLLLQARSDAGDGSGGSGAAGLLTGVSLNFGSDGTEVNATLGAITLDAGSLGSPSFDGSRAGGNARAGSVSINLQSRGVQLVAGDLSADVSAVAGAGIDGFNGFFNFVPPSAGTDGGSAQGGRFGLSIASSSAGVSGASDMTIGTLTVVGQTIGGAGGRGGEATGSNAPNGAAGANGGAASGAAFDWAMTGGNFAMGDLVADMAAFGGNGGDRGRPFAGGVAGAGGSGGTAQAGTASFALSEESDFDTPFAFGAGDLSLVVLARGGEAGAGGAIGGDGRGGTILFSTNGAGNMALQSLLLDARGEGGSAQDAESSSGGAGQGGTIDARLGAGSLGVAGPVPGEGGGVVLLSSGSGGESADADGGAATGGAATLTLGQGRLDSDGLLIDAQASGGTGALSVGNATGGDAALLFADARGVADLGNNGLFMIADASGAAAAGGTVLVDVGGGSLTTAGDFGLFAAGTGGNALARTDGGSIDIGGDASVDVGGVAALAVDGGGRIAVGGNLDVRGDEVADSLVGIALAAPGQINVAGSTDIAARIILGSLQFVGAGPITVTGTQALTLGGLGGPGAMTLRTEGVATVVGDVLTEGALSIEAGERIVTANIDAAGGIALAAAGGDVTTGALLSQREISVLSGGAISAGLIDTDAQLLMLAASDFVLGNVTSGGTGLTLVTDNGSVRTGDIDAAGAVRIEASGDVALGNVLAAEQLFVVAGGDSGSVGVGNVETDRSIILLAGREIETGSLLTNGEGLTLLASNEMLAGFSGSPEDLSGEPLRQLLGSVTVDGTAGTGSLLVAAGTSAEFSGAIDVVDMQIVANGLVDFQAPVNGSALAVSSGDIAIADRFGNMSTSSILLDVNRGGQLTIGGVDAPGSWSLSAIEMRRLRAADIAITALGGEGSTRVQIDGFTLQGSRGEDPNLTGSSLTIRTDGTVTVDQPAVIVDAGADDMFRIEAGQIFVRSDLGGQLAVLRNETDPFGLLSLEARNIYVGTQALISDLLLDGNFAGRNNRLNAVATSALPNAQQLVGGIVDVVIDGAFLVQNASTGSVRAGIDARTLRISPSMIESGANASGVPVRPPVDVVINGQTRNEQNTPITNNFTLETVAFRVLQNERGYTETTQVNGCLRSAANCAPVPEPEPEPESKLGLASFVAPFVQSIGNDVQQLTDEERQRLLGLPVGLNTSLRPDQIREQLQGFDQVIDPVYVDEPLTGSGNGGQFLGAGRSLFGMGQGAEPGIGAAGTAGAGRGLFGVGQGAEPNAVPGAESGRGIDRGQSSDFRSTEEQQQPASSLPPSDTDTRPVEQRP